MITTRNALRVLAAAVASAGFAAVSTPTLADTLTCTSASFRANADASGNIQVTCTVPSSGGDSGGGTTNPPPVDTGGGTPPPPSDGWAGTCPGYSKTIVYDLPWNAQSKITTKGFANGTMLVARFTTPNTSVQSGSATIASAEWLPPRVTRSASISTSPCDLGGTGTGAVSGGWTQTPGWTYQILGTASRLSGRVVLQPNTTYYVNIVNRDSAGQSTCTTSTCEMIVQLTVPTGL
jgi:hypothetical protein